MPQLHAALEDIWKRLYPSLTQFCRNETESVLHHEDSTVVLANWTRTASYLDGNTSWRAPKLIHPQT
jgi:hypothetical protein